MLTRLLRIGGIAAGLGALFALSQQAGVQRGDEDVAGMSWAIGVVAAVLSLRALATELTQSADRDWQKDLLWGLALGAVIGIVIRH